jgi:choline kinase
MAPLSNYLHKAMVPFQGTPLLAYSLLSIPKRSEVVIVVNHLHEQITKYFGNSYKGRRIQYFKQVNPKGTGDALVQFSKAYHPKEPVIVWQADQIVYANEISRLQASEPDAAVVSDTGQGLVDIGLWKIKPGTLVKLNRHFENGEYRALPVLRRQQLKKIRIQREKLEISFETWGEIERRCSQLHEELLTKQ